MPVGDYIKLFDSDGSFYIIDPKYEQTIDAAVTRYIDSGKTIDTLLDLELAEGASFRFLASKIIGWIYTTPETRKAYLDFTHSVFQEEKSTKASLGIFEED